MSRNGSGTYTLPSGTFNPAVSGATPTAADWNSLASDLTTAISASIANDGQTTCSARIPFAAGISITGGGLVLQNYLEVSSSTAVIAPAALSANTNNWNPTGLSGARIVRVSASSAINITGIVPPATGRAIVLRNVGSFAITLTHEDSNSTATNRLKLPTYLQTYGFVLEAQGSVELWYDITDSRWVLSGIGHSIDYKEGTFTPSLGGTATYTAQNGYYEKIGRAVFFKIRLTVNTIGTGSTYLISGLPFTAAVAANAGGIGYFQNAAAAVVSAGWYVSSGSNSVNITTLAAAATGINATPNFFGSGTDVMVEGFYHV